MKQVELNPNLHWAWLWKAQIPENAKFFLWQVGHDAFPTREFLRRMHTIADELYLRCGTITEYISHILWKCGSIDLVGKFFNISLPSDESLSLGWLNWIHISITKVGAIFPIMI